MTYGLMGLYIGLIVAANLLAGRFIGSVSLGTLTFGATFTVRDALHRSGRRPVYAALAVAMLLVLGLALLHAVPWRILVASLVAVALSETLDTEVFHALRRRSWLARVLASNAVAIPVDTLLFNLIAFRGVLPWSFLAGVILTDILIKYLAAGVVIVPLWRWRQA